MVWIILFLVLALMVTTATGAHDGAFGWGLLAATLWLCLTALIISRQYIELQYIINRNSKRLKNVVSKTDID